MADPLVTVILPCYNAHQHLDDALNSVLTQTYQKIEIIVVNDGSTKSETLDYLSSVGSSINVIHQENKGLPAARNRGFSEAQGEFVLPLDCDDWLEPNAIAQLLKVVKFSGEGVFAFPQMILEDQAAGTTTKHYNHFEQLFLNQLPYCLLLPKVVWEKIGGYDESMRQGYEDWEFNIRLGVNGWRAVTVAEPLFHYRVTESGMLLSTSGRQHCELWDAIRRKHPEIYQYRKLKDTWLKWRKNPSSYPLWFYFMWLTANSIMPTAWASKLFSWARRYSNSRRVTRAYHNRNTKMIESPPKSATMNSSGNTPC